MNRTTLEFVLNSMYIAIVSAGMTDHQRALANDTLFMCADLPCAPPSRRRFYGALPATRSIKRR